MQFQIHRHGTIASTSETAFEALAARTARHGDVHVAAAQTRGRGRLGRSWHSAPGEGLYLSAVLLPRHVLSPAGLTIAAGLAVLDAVNELGLSRARLKWPNDVIVPTSNGDAKLAGILVETRGLDPARPHYVVGIGVNVAQASFPPELTAERAVASLKTCGVEVDVATVLEALLPHLAARVEQITTAPARLARDFVTATGLNAERVFVVAGDRELTGRIESFDLDSGLVMLTPSRERIQLPLEIVRELRALTS
jgi:BirA family biotin operon repressor/biotin-[acetyl-CoA-carboxylase] ligase